MMSSTGRLSKDDSEAEHIIIVGGGVVGAACAYYLSQAGRRVTIIDRGKFGRACSHGNCGFICPSHVLPLCRPGVIAKTLMTLFNPYAPFRIKPRFDPSLWRWLLQFARRCNRTDMIRGGEARHALLQSSASLYRQLIEDGQLQDCEFETRGLLFVFKTQREMDQFAQLESLVSEEFGVGAVFYDDRRLVAMEPAIKPGMAGAFYYEEDAHLRPDRLMAAWRDRLVQLGVTIFEECELRGFVNDKGRALAVVTSTGTMPADAFIVATGAWSPQWNRALGCRLPVQPGKGISITMPRTTCCPKYPMLLAECCVGVTPFASGYRLGSTMEFTGFDEQINRHRLGLLSRGAKQYLVEPNCQPIEEEWFGFRPMSCDGVPIIDRSPAMSNVLIATGHSMLGVSMSPATGKLVAEMLTGVSPHVDVSAYRLSRF